MKEICVVRFDDIVNREGLIVGTLYNYPTLKCSKMEVKRGILADKNSVGIEIYFHKNKQQENFYIIKNKKIEDIEDLQRNLDNTINKFQLTREKFNIKNYAPVKNYGSVKKSKKKKEEYELKVELYEQFHDGLKKWADINKLDMVYYRDYNYNLKVQLNDIVLFCKDRKMFPINKCGKMFTSYKYGKWGYLYETVNVKAHYAFPDRLDGKEPLGFYQYYKGALSDEYIYLSQLSDNTWWNIECGFYTKIEELDKTIVDEVYLNYSKIGIKIHKFLYTEWTNTEGTITLESGEAEEMFAVVTGEIIEILNKNNLIKKIALADVDVEEYLEKINNLKYT